MCKTMIDMRTLLILLFALALFSSCSKESKLTQINGSITGMGNDTILIYDEYSLDATLDTIVVENGKFSIELPIDTLKILTLLFKDGTEYPLFVDKQQKLQVKGDTASLPMLLIEDEGPNQLYHTFEIELQAAQSLDEVQKSNIVEDYILGNNSSIVSVYLLDKYFTRGASPNLSKIKDLISSLSGVMQDQPAIGAINDRVSAIDKISTSRSVPFFNIPDSAGNKLTRSNNFADKYLVLTIWASWDDSSRVNNEALRRMKKKYDKYEDFGLLGISLDINRKDWLDAIKADSLTWEQVSDLGGMNSNGITQFGVHTLPTNYLVSSTGIILMKDVSADSISNRLPFYLKKEKKPKANKKAKSQSTKTASK